MGFNSAFKGLMYVVLALALRNYAVSIYTFRVVVKQCVLP